MKYLEILNELTYGEKKIPNVKGGIESRANIEKFLETKVAKQCSEIIAIMKVTKKLLYRGLVGPNPDFFEGKSRNKRKASDSNAIMSELFDNYLKQNGIKARRHNSIFVTPNLKRARSFGKIYAIFPKNGFDFSYTRVKDLVLDDASKFANLEQMKKFELAVQKHYPTFQWRRDWAIGHNVSIGNGYLMYANKKPYKVKQFFDLTELERYFKNLNASDTNITIPMLKNSEILISGEYYAFDYFMFRQTLTKFLGFKI